MAVYTVMLTPEVVTQASEGNLDTSVMGGMSVQRTFNDTMVVNGSDRKMVGRIADGGSYDDTTFDMVVNDIVAGNPNFDAGAPVVGEDNVTAGHPTASSDTGSTL